MNKFFKFIFFCVENEKDRYATPVMLIIVQVLKESHHANWQTVNILQWERAAYIVRCVVRSTRQQDDWYVNRKGPQSNIRRKIDYLFILQMLFVFYSSIMISSFTQLGKVQCVGIQGKWTHILRWQLSLYRDCHSRKICQHFTVFILTSEYA